MWTVTIPDEQENLVQNSTKFIRYRKLDAMKKRDRWKVKDGYPDFHSLHTTS